MDGNRSVGWFGAFVAVVALAGVAGGVLLDRYLLAPHRPGDGRRPGTGAAMGLGRGGMQALGPGGGGRGMMRPGWLNERLAADLELTSRQREQLAEILSRRRAKLDQVRSEMQGRMQAEQKELRDEIRAILDPKQQKRFDEVMPVNPLRGEPGFGSGPGGPGTGRGRGGMPPGH
jgi:hypothetical protein